MSFPCWLVAEETIKSLGRELRINRRVLNVFVPHIELQSTRVLPIVGQFISGGVAQHMRMNGEAKTGSLASPADDLL